MAWRTLLLLLLCHSLTLAADKTLRLQIGDPSRKGKEAKVVLDAITDTASGELLTPRELASRLAGAGIVFLGESHTSMDFHRVQHRVIQELERSGKKVLIGLEMYPYTEQKYLDDWCQGLLTEAGFIQISRWYKNWGYHWNYYRDIFLLARDRRMGLFAVNAPREVVSAVRKKGFQNLTAEETAHIPTKIDTENAEHYTLFKAFFEGGEGMHSSMDESAWKSMFEAQCTWDATMAYNAVRALKEHGTKDAVMVVLIGSGHVAYGLGIQRQAKQWYDGKMASVIPIQVQDEKDQPVEIVQASYADFLWGLPQERDPIYPEPGFATGDIPGDTRRKVLSVSKDSPAKLAGFEVGDVLISMDGIPLLDREILNRLLSEKRWGDAASFVVRRPTGEVSLQVYFRRRQPPADSRKP